MILPAAIGVSILGGAVHGMFHRNSRVFGSVLGKLPGNGRKVSLTFDDGPNADATPKILDALGEHRIKATFFILGAHAERFPDIVRRITGEGHQIGNHGYFHRKLHLKSPFYVKRDIVLGKRAIERAAGDIPRFFRAPHGFRSPWVTAIARSLGERTIGWSLGVWDSDRPGVKAIVDRTIQGARPGSIILLHDGDGYNVNGDRAQTAAAVPEIIMRLRDRGFEFVTLPSA